MVNRLDVHTFIYFELASSSIVLVRYRPQFSRQAYSFLEVNQRRLRRNTWECKYDTREKNLSAVLANSIQLSLEGEVNSGGYIPRREASRYISTALHRP